jgi:aspartate carbamoyltransferase catalytic subunit
MPRLLLSVDDLTDEAIERILSRADELRGGSSPTAMSGRAVVVGLVFLEASLRTRVGFSAAAARLGWYSLDILEQRSSATSMPESWDDTLRTVSGLVDLVVARPGRPLDRKRVAVTSVAPFISGGDTGPRAEHPSQALIDVFAIEDQRGPTSTLNIAICGDLRMRVVHSLVRLFARRPPRRLVLITAQRLRDEASLPSSLSGITEYRALGELEDVDVLYVAGIPHCALPDRERERLRVNSRVLAALSEDAIVLSPLPLLDEIDEAARCDPRVHMFQQSDIGVFVRMALLEEMVN